MLLYWKILRCWFSTIYVGSPSTLQLNVTITIVKSNMKFLILHHLPHPQVRMVKLLVVSLAV